MDSPAPDGSPGPLRLEPFGPAPAAPGDSDLIVQESPIGRCWAGMYVDQALLVTGERTHAAYYAPDRRLVVAEREGAQARWRHQALETTLGWDSHNYVCLGAAPDGTVHVSGNMHDDPLVYFTTDTTGRVETLRRSESMTDPATERSVTYPQFLNTADGTLYFAFRDGRSGHGATYVNVYRDGRWLRALDTALFNGGTDPEGAGRSWSAYHEGPQLGPDGRLHLAWVWRASPDAASNSLLTYARSEDLASWTTADGSPLAVPFTYGAGDVVDASPEGAGLINGNAKIGFDADGEVLVLFHKYDRAGNSQLFAARPRRAGWAARQITGWTGRWTFGGAGTLHFEVRVLGTAAMADRSLRHDVLVHGQRWSVVTDHDFNPIAQHRTAPLPASIANRRGEDPGLEVNVAPDPGSPTLLRWESLPSHNDRPRRTWPVDGTSISLVQQVRTAES